MIPSFNVMTANGVIEKYCYDNSPSNCVIFGGLYQWDEMMQYTYFQGIQGICPTGWHLPTNLEWTTLIIYLGGDNVAGGKMKETGTTHWNPPNTGASNISGFTSLPAGTRYNGGGTSHLGKYNFLWSSTQNDSYNAWYIRPGYDYAGAGGGTYIDKWNGFSVRCLKDN